VNSTLADSRNVVYFVRTDSLQKEARVARLFRALKEKGSDVEVFGIVKSEDGFSYSYREYVCRSDSVRWKLLKVLLKLIEIQVTSLRTFRAHYRNRDLLIIANHEFLLVGLIIRLFTRMPVVVDLHEHYYTWLFGIKQFSQFFFLRLFSGVIFANRPRAKEFLSDRAASKNVAIVRNFPQMRPGVVFAPRLCSDSLYRVGIVGGDVPGRYIGDSVRALDRPEFKNQIEIRTFGQPLGIRPAHVSIAEHGPYRHWEILELLKTVDSSLVFYDPHKTANNRLCEPNRFFEAYNSGLTIFCFDHSSLSEFYDEFCSVVDQHQFEVDLSRAMRMAIEDKMNRQRNLDSTIIVKRRLLVFDEGIENLEFLVQIKRN